MNFLDQVYLQVSCFHLSRYTCTDPVGTTRRETSNATYIITFQEDSNLDSDLDDTVSQESSVDDLDDEDSEDPDDSENPLSASMQLATTNLDPSPGLDPYTHRTLFEKQSPYIHTECNTRFHSRQKGEKHAKRGGRKSAQASSVPTLRDLVLMQDEAIHACPRNA